MIDPDATRQAFAGLIEKPALTDQLLSRPPFKFILDVVTNTITSTGYLKSQFPKSDLDPAVLADKAAKTTFLDKLIAAVDDGSLSGVKSAKIVAGKEPELTNKLLLKFAENARNYLAGGPSEKKPKEKSSKEKSSKDKSKPDSKNSSKDKDRSKSKDREKEKDKEKEKKSSSKDKKERSSSKSRDKEKSKDKDEKKDKKSKKSDDKEKSEKKRRKASVGEATSPEAFNNSESIVDKDMDEGFEETHQLSPHQLPEKRSPGNDSGILELDEQPLVLRPPPQEFQRPSTAAARPQTSMGRPGTAAARPAPPKIKKKVIATIEEAPALIESVVQIMSEEAHKDEEKHDLFVEEAIEEENPLVADIPPTQIEAEEGGLVQKMMETKAGLEEGQLLDELDEDDSEFQREVNKLNDLQKTLQSITRTIFPLAHIFEFAQDDLEAMMRELEKWRGEVRQNEAELKEKESMSMGEAQKLSGTLSNLDEEIRNIKVNLSNCKARIVANEDRIQLLMKDV